MTIEEVTSEQVEPLFKTLSSNKFPLSVRFRALFKLKHIGTLEAIDAIINSFSLSNSALLNHELAYVLGQIKNKHAIPALSDIISAKYDSMTRHEACEALGAIGI